MNQITSGRRPTALDIELVGEVSMDDLVQRQQGAGTAGHQPASLARIRGIHHELAQMLAKGMRPAEISAATGYCASRISTLQNDPMFKELVQFYTNSQKEIFRDVNGQIASLASDAVGELQARLEQTPEQFSVGALTELAKMTLDRSGHAPVAKTVSVSGNLADIASIKEKAQRSQNENVTVLEQLPSSAGTSDSTLGD